MDNLNDAIEVLLLNDGESVEQFYEEVQREIEKYKNKEKN